MNHFAATASTAASAVDLVDEDDDHLDKHALNDGHVWEAVNASVAFTAAQPVEIDATEAEAAAASKAATAAHKAAAKAACTPSEEDDLLKKSSGAADPTGEACFAALPLFEVGDWVRVLPVTAPGSLPRLATGFPEATVVAYDAHTGEYTVRTSVMCSRQQTKIPRNAVVAVSRVPRRQRGIENSRWDAQQRGSKGGSPGREIDSNQFIRITQVCNMLILNNIAASNFIIGVHLHGKRCTHTVHFLNHYQ